MGWQKGWTFYPVNDKDPVVHEDPKLNQPDDQNIKELWADFMSAIESGKKPVSDIGEIALSTNMALLGMLSMKLGRSIRWDADKWECPGDAEANKLLKREYRNGYDYPV